MALVRIDTDGLQRNINSMHGYIRRLESLTIDMNKLLADISGSWEGKASEAYIGAMKDRLWKAQQMRGVLEAFVGYMETAKREIESLDDECASRIRDC